MHLYPHAQIMPTRLCVQPLPAHVSTHTRPPTLPREPAYLYNHGHYFLLLPSTANFYTRRNARTDITSHSLALLFFPLSSFLLYFLFFIFLEQAFSFKYHLSQDETEVFCKLDVREKKHKNIWPSLVPHVREAEIAILILCILSSPLNKRLNR